MSSLKYQTFLRLAHHKLPLCGDYDVPITSDWRWAPTNGVSHQQHLCQNWMEVPLSLAYACLPAWGHCLAALLSLCSHAWIFFPNTSMLSTSLSWDSLLILWRPPSLLVIDLHTGSHFSSGQLWVTACLPTPIPSEFSFVSVPRCFHSCDYKPQEGTLISQ